MYSHLKFAQPRSVTTVDFEKLATLGRKQFTYESQQVESSILSITDSGQLMVGGQSKQMLQTAFVSLCKQLKIPDPFAKYIPWDLLEHNINQLSKSSGKPMQLLIREDGVVANVVWKDFVPIPHEEFLALFKVGMPEITRGIISDTGLQIDVVDPLFGDNRFKDIKVKVGDIVKTGLSFHNSTAGYHFTKAMLFLWKLSCSNGMLMPTKLGFAKLRAKPGRDISVSLANFLNQVSSMMVDSKLIGQRLRELNRPLISSEFSRSWKGLMKIVRDDGFLEEQIFEVSEEQRKLWLAEDRAHKKDPEIPLTKTTVNGYTMLNSITHRAKKFDQTTRKKLEVYSGKIIMGFGSISGELIEA